MVLAKLNLRLSQLKRFVVVDKEDYDIGEPMDLALNSEDNYQASHLIIGGGFIEELLEELEKREDIDEYIDFNLIKEVDNEAIILSVDESKIPKTNASGDLPEHLIRFAELYKKKIHNKQGQEIVEILDIAIENSKTVIVTQNVEFNRNMRMMHQYGQRFEFIIPIEKLEINNGLIFDLTLEEMEKLVFDKFEATQRGVDKIYL